MCTNVLPKTQRLYQRVIEEEKKSLERAEAINNFRRNNPLSSMNFKVPEVPYQKEIEINESESSSVQSNYQQRENMGSSHISKRSESEGITPRSSIPPG
jgi:hypothetical protein